MSHPGPPSTAARRGLAFAVQGRHAVLIAAVGLLAAILGLLPPLIKLYKDNRDSGPPPAAGAATTRPEHAGQSPQPTQPAVPPGTVPPGFVGTWVGSINQEGSSKSPYPVTVTITAGGLAQRVGTSAYLTLDCDGHLILASAEGNRLVVQENIDNGTSNCVEQTQITLTLNGDGTIAYRIEPQGFFVGEADGTLHRQG
ncbi:MAG TPA: hypothetical protein VGD67_09415 [Pseudonocardiaceae bacterium]